MHSGNRRSCCSFKALHTALEPAPTFTLVTLGSTQLHYGVQALAAVLLNEMSAKKMNILWLFESHAASLGW